MNSFLGQARLSRKRPWRIVETVVTLQAQQEGGLGGRWRWWRHHAILAIIRAEWVIGAVWVSLLSAGAVVASLLPHQATQKLPVSTLAEKEQ